MPRKSNESFNNMTINEVVGYTIIHPADGARTAKELGKASAECLGLYIDYQISKAKKVATPRHLGPDI